MTTAREQRILELAAARDHLDRALRRLGAIPPSRPRESSRGEGEAARRYREWLDSPTGRILHDHMVAIHRTIPAEKAAVTAARRHVLALEPHRERATS